MRVSTGEEKGGSDRGSLGQLPPVVKAETAAPREKSERFPSSGALVEIP